MRQNREDLRACLSRFAWGYVFFLLNINLGTLEILPNWVGMLLFYKALPVLAQWQPDARLLPPLAVLLGWCEGVSWLLALVDVSLPELVSILVAVVSLYFHFQLLTNLADLADDLGCAQGKNLRIFRTINVLLATCTALPLPWARIPLAATLLMGVSLILLIGLLYNLFSLRNRISSTPESL